MNSLRRWLVRGLALGVLGSAVAAEELQQISQYGITWTFDRAYPAGRFVTGDWWVVGPVTVVSVGPAPGPAAAEAGTSVSRSRYGAEALRDDARMRNGSMIVTDAAPAAPAGKNQGYDSRVLNYDPALSVAFPCRLEVDRSLISTISSAHYDDKGKLATPSAAHGTGFMLFPATQPLALEGAAVLTCLAAAPPADAFRPPYVGTAKPIYRASDLRLDILPRLPPVPATPDWETMIRQFERPWLDHLGTWLVQHTMPGQNQPAYGREFARLTSLASLMLMLDAPAETKRRLAIGYVQLGIDLHGAALCGRQWFSDGGHWQGRKWPILLSSLLLDRPELRSLPVLTPGQVVYGRLRYQPESGDAPATTLFQEDLDTYYGLGGDGQRVLWQIVVHTGVQEPHEEVARASFAKREQFVDAYRANNSGAWIGAALSAQLLGARALWNHDAFFDYVDRWMRPEEKTEVPRWLPPGCTRSVDPFAEQMWAAYRGRAPQQPGAADPPRTWVWNADHAGGRWVANPPAAP